MDPIQGFNDMTTAFVGKHWTEARELACSLLGWLAKRGFPPCGMSVRDVQGYCIVIERIARHHIERGES